MTKFGILGYGYVGKATHLSLLKDKECIIHDLTLGSRKEDLKQVNIVFICIPTETHSDIDLMIKEIRDLKTLNPKMIIVIRSTLPLGSCVKIQKEVGSIIYIPEFLRERFWNIDCHKRPLIAGCDNLDMIPEWLLEEDVIKCKTNEAEMIKMFSNNFAVVRIAFANLFYDLSEKVGADYNLVKDSFLKIEHAQTYMEVPGHDGSRGFGGKCLPKDLDFLIKTLEEHDIKQDWFKHIRDLNREWLKKS